MQNLQSEEQPASTPSNFVIPPNVVILSEAKDLLFAEIGNCRAPLGTTAYGRHRPCRCIVRELRKWSTVAMRINIDIDDDLMREAMRLSGARTKKSAVESGLRLLVGTHAQQSIRRLKGKVRWEGNLAVSRRGRLCSLSIALLLICSLYSGAQTATSNAKAAADLIPITLDMDWTRGSPHSHYGPDFIQLLRPCQREETSCECVMNFKVISSRENSKEFADYIASFGHGKVPVTYEVSYGQDGVVHNSRLVSVGDWKKEKFQTNDTALGVEVKFVSGGPRKQSTYVHSPGDCFPSRNP